MVCVPVSADTDKRLLNDGALHAAIMRIPGGSESKIRCHGGSRDGGRGRTRARAVIDKRLDRIPSLSGPRMLYGSLVAAEATSSEAQRHRRPRSWCFYWRQGGNGDAEIGELEDGIR